MPKRSQGETSRALNQLIAPLIHSSDFSVQRLCYDGVSFGRTFFTSLNFSTHLFASLDGEVICAFSGYLFDTNVLRKQVLQESGGSASTANPAELLGYLFPRHGSRLLTNLSGSYTFALWENKSRTLTLGTDRYGMMSLYYQHRGSQFAFASEIKSLLSLEPDSDINFSAFSELLALGSPQSDHTLYPTVMRLPSATVLSFCSGIISTEQYWLHGGVQVDPKLGLNEFVEETQRLFSRSVTRLTQQIDQPICLLSAGHDSRRILFELVKHGKPVTAYTASTVQHSNPYAQGVSTDSVKRIDSYTYDVPIASALCEALGVSHVAAGLPSTSSYGDLARHALALLDFETDYHSWILPLLAELRVGAGVNFDGLGGDVLYEHTGTYEDEASHIADPAYLAKAVLHQFPDLWKECFRIDAPKPTLVERIEQILRNLPNFADRLTVFYFSNWTRRKTALFSHGLLSLKIDSVYPFLDYDLMDHVFRLPPLVRRSADVSRAMLFLSNPEIMRRIPSSHDQNRASESDSYYRKFRQPLPKDYWLEMRASICREAAVDILETGGILGQLTRRAQLSAVAHRAFRPNWHMPRRLVLSGWRLPPIGLYALQRRTAQSKAVAQLQLSKANSFVYGP